MMRGTAGKCPAKFRNNHGTMLGTMASLEQYKLASRGLATLLLLATLAAVEASPQQLPAPRVSHATAADTTANALSQWTRKLWDKQQEVFREQQVAWQRRLDRNGRPPVGAIYVGTMKMPVIGRQTFMLRVLDRQRCQIVLIGP